MSERLFSDASKHETNVLPYIIYLYVSLSFLSLFLSLFCARTWTTWTTKLTLKLMI